MRWSIGSLVAGALVVTVACGGSKNPAAPSAVAADPGLVTSGSPSSGSPGSGTPGGSPTVGVTGSAAVVGVVTTGSAGRSVRTSGAGLSVQVVGTNLSAGVGNDGSFSLQGVPSGDVKLHFSGDGIDATVTLSSVQSGQSIEIKVTVSGSTGSIDSDSRKGGDATERELEGKVESLGADALVVAGQSVRVNASTVVRQDGRTMAFSDIKVGTRVHVKARTDGSSLLATAIDIQAEPGEQPLEAKGTVSALSGSCPTLSFTLGSVTVETSSSTAFGAGACAALKNGATVEANGTKDAATGHLKAKTVKIEDAQETETELKGMVAGLTGSCPTLNFTVGSVTVDVTSATTFGAGNCGSLKNGASVQVNGTKDATTGHVKAKSIKIEDAAEQEMEAKGVVAGLSGSCPTASFTLGSVTVDLSSATNFKSGSCSTVKNGATVEVSGTKDAATGHLKAKTLKVEDAGEQEMEAKGTAASLSGACPTVSFTIGSVTVDVTASTSFEDGSCSSLKNGASVEAKGTKDATTGHLKAKQVKVQNAKEDEMEAKGTAAGVAGSCPTVAFTIGSVTVDVTSATSFKSGSCALIKNGASVEAKGTKDATTGHLKATEVKVESAQTGGQEFEATGALSSLSGTCPAITFTVNGTPVDATSSTEFKTSCASLKSGDKVQVKGTKGADGRVRASEIRRE